MIDEELVVLEDHVGGGVLFLDLSHELPQLPTTLPHSPGTQLSDFPSNFLSCVYSYNVDGQFSN